jgi:hypothetical protein
MERPCVALARRLTGIPGSAQEWHGRVEAALEQVALDPPQVLHEDRHQLSVGQLQRLRIERAPLLDIRLLVADEIISMLDACPVHGPAPAPADPDHPGLVTVGEDHAGACFRVGETTTA